MILDWVHLKHFQVLIFALWLTSSVLVVNNIKAGLDQKMAVPEVFLALFATNY